MNDVQRPRPKKWSLSNWPVRWKVVAIVLVPLLLAGAFGGLRVHSGWTDARELRLAADRVDVLPAIEKYLAALDDALVTNSPGRDIDTSKQDLQRHVADTGVTTLLTNGQALLDQVAANGIDLRARITAYAPVLLTAQDVITASAGMDDEQVRAETSLLSRAIGVRGQVAMQQLLVDSGGALPESELRTSLITLAGAESSTIAGLIQILGAGSPDAKKLQAQLTDRLATTSDPAVGLVGNPELTQSLQGTDAIASKIIDSTTASITSAVEDQANVKRQQAIRDSAIVGAAILLALVVVLLVARTLVRPLRTLRDGALKVAHEDLTRELEQLRTGDDPGPVRPLPVHTTEEVGQVAHAIDELHEQAVVLAGEQARLQVQVDDVFETLSRRNRSLVEQQAGLIERLERDEEDPERLESLVALDHLAARMRRNGANLLVLAGSRVPREQVDSAPIAALVNAAASEVEDYARIVTAMVPASEVRGVVTGDLVHVLAELLDNALRYSPPTSQVQVSAMHTGDGGLLVEVCDVGLGMTDSDLRVANARLQSSGEVNPFTARHMGLFVVGRLAAQHGLDVRLRNTVAGVQNSGMTASVYLPAEFLLRGAGADDTRPISLLPQRNPGVDDIANIPSAPIERIAPPLAPPVSDWPDERWPADAMPAPAPRRQPDRPRQAPADTSSFFAARDQVSAEPSPPAAGGSIFENMLSEWLIDDPTQLAESTDLDWQTVWDHGWSAAAAAADAPVEQRTEHGLPIRQPGARLVPGSAGEGGA